MARYVVSVERLFGGWSKFNIEADSKVSAKSKALDCIHDAANYNVKNVKVKKVNVWKDF